MDDLIRRQAAIDATWEEPSYTDPLNVLTEVRDRIEALPPAQRTGRCEYWDAESNFCALHRPSAQPNLQPTCNQLATDCISRQAAIDFIDAGHLVNPNEPRWSDNEVVNFLKSRPSAQRTGRWIDMDDHVMCSCCGATHYGADKNYCPNCGARMEEQE